MIEILLCFLFWSSLKWRQNCLALLEYAGGTVVISRDVNTYQEKCVGYYCPSFLTLTSLFCHLSISIFLAYLYSLITCLVLFHKTVPPSKGRWWYTFFLVSPCLCPFPILYKWVESLECSCTWQPELENDAYVGYIWRIYVTRFACWVSRHSIAGVQLTLFPRLYLLLWTDEEFS